MKKFAVSLGILSVLLLGGRDGFGDSAPCKIEGTNITCPFQKVVEKKKKKKKEMSNLKGFLYGILGGSIFYLGTHTALRRGPK